MAGFEDTGDGDACTWASEPEQARGFMLSIELSGERTPGVTKPWMADDEADNAAEVRVENAGGGDGAYGEDESGIVELGAYAPGDRLELVGMRGVLSNGMSIHGASLAACYCGTMMVE